MDELRHACAAVATRARSVTVVTEAIPAYAAALRGVPAHAAQPASAQPAPAQPTSAPPTTSAEREACAACWLTMDAINFGSGWFPTLRKRAGLSGYNTIAAALRDRFDTHGAWTAAELTQLDAVTLGPVLGQDPDHELIALYSWALRDLGDRCPPGTGGASPPPPTRAGTRPSRSPTASEPGRPR